MKIVETDDKKIEIWWNETRDNEYWSGSIVGLRWHQLWDGAKDELRKIYEGLT